MFAVAVVGIVGLAVIGMLLWQWWAGALEERPSTSSRHALAWTVGAADLSQVPSGRFAGERRRRAA